MQPICRSCQDADSVPRRAAWIAIGVPIGKEERAPARAEVRDAQPLVRQALHLLQPGTNERNGLGSLAAVNGPGLIANGLFLAGLQVPQSDLQIFDIMRNLLDQRREIALRCGRTIPLRRRLGHRGRRIADRAAAASPKGEADGGEANGGEVDDGDTRTICAISDELDAVDVSGPPVEPTLEGSHVPTEWQHLSDRWRT